MARSPLTSRPKRRISPQLGKGKLPLPCLFIIARKGALSAVEPEKAQRVIILPKRPQGDHRTR